MSDYLQPHGPQHVRLPCLSQTPGACSKSCSSSCDAIQSFHPLLSPSPPAFNLSQHQGIFQWVSSSYQAARVLELQLQHQSFQWMFRTDFLYDWLVWTPCSPRDHTFSSVAQLCPPLCDLIDCSTPGVPVHHQLPELARIHVHQVGDTIQTSHPLSSLSPPAFNLSQHQGIFHWVSSSYQVTKVLELQL